ncbi:hypothetical protein EPR50_G00236520 [Perca flavescens]|uniref:Uncharacterized protein n=1 Tax=Perca flavescens TaxID=8167 RepID=A0A484C3P2_PERFV|nr:hypothetical protein EPR50_G00236520 [Perca flavescens]
MFCASSCRKVGYAMRDLGTGCPAAVRRRCRTRRWCRSAARCTRSPAATWRTPKLRPTAEASRSWWTSVKDGERVRNGKETSRGNLSAGFIKSFIKSLQNTYSMKVVEAAAQVLNTLWQYRELRNLYKQPYVNVTSAESRTEVRVSLHHGAHVTGTSLFNQLFLERGAAVSPAVRVEGKQNVSSHISKSKNDVPVQPNLNIFPTILMGGRRRSFRPNCPLPRPAAEQGPERRELLHVVTLPTSAPPSRARPPRRPPPASSV